MNRTIILDRDGVINFDAPTGIHTPEMWRAIPGSLMAIADLNRAGWQVFVITNQSGIARGYYDLQALSDIHEKMLQELSAVGGCIQEIFFCPHHPAENCLCRKPRPGLFQLCQKKYDLDLTGVWYVGDKHSDVEAAKSAGCEAVLVKSGQGSDTLRKFPTVCARIFPDLAAVAACLLQQEPYS